MGLKLSFGKKEYTSGNNLYWVSLRGKHSDGVRDLLDADVNEDLEFLLDGVARALRAAHENPGKRMVVHLHPSLGGEEKRSITGRINPIILGKRDKIYFENAQTYLHGFHLLARFTTDKMMREKR